MRYIANKTLLNTIFSDPTGEQHKKRLDRAHRKATNKLAEDRKLYIDKYGSKKWSPLKDCFTTVLGDKCWYTEAELVGAPLTIDHYRPKGDYWFLAFEAENFRVACPFANSPKYNEEHGCAGGKGDNFPLIDPAMKAATVNSVHLEKPVILDPCCEADCELIAFYPDGRPIVNPSRKHEHDAVYRVEQSKLLLNLDHPAFNSKREQLYFDIRDDVETYEELPSASNMRPKIRARLQNRISAKAPFSVASRNYLSAYRYLDWVASMLMQETP